MEYLFHAVLLLLNEFTDIDILLSIAFTTYQLSANCEMKENEKHCLIYIYNGTLLLKAFSLAESARLNAFNLYKYTKIYLEVNLLEIDSCNHIELVTLLLNSLRVLKGHL